MASMTGGCLCGAVRYTTDAAAIFSGVCHCTNCQRQTGSAFSEVIAVPKPMLTVTGETRSFAHKGDSGHDVIATFCPVCATTASTAMETA